MAQLFSGRRRFAAGELGGVKHTADLDRILALPRRKVDVDEIRGALTDFLSQHPPKKRTQSLWPEQALFLHDLFEYRGVFANFRCGGGKTLCSLLAGALLELRTLLLVPSELVTKTLDEAKEYAEHWRFEMPQVLGYGMLSHPDHVDDIEIAQPELIVADEGHALINIDAACTARVGAYLGAHPKTVLAVLSGTLIDTSLLRYHRLLRWALGPEHMPLPASEEVVLAWAQALDPQPPAGKARLELGALRTFGETPAEVASGLGQWMADSPGCVFSSGEGIGTSLQLRAWTPPRPPAVVRDAITVLRRDKKRPDGVDLDDNAVGRVQAQLNLGYYLYWYPPPPKPWLKARKEWYGYCRRIVAARYGGLDSMARIEKAIIAEGVEIRELENWLAVRDTYKYKRKVKWLDTSVIEEAARLAKSLPNCIVWSSNRCVGRKLEKLGLPHFDKGGRNSEGERIDKTKTKHISASIKANFKGRNLQQFNYNLILNPMRSAQGWEQLLARTHRPGQKADTVYAYVLASRDMKAVLRDARHLGRMGTFQHKLDLADWVGL